MLGIIGCGGITYHGLGGLSVVWRKVGGVLITADPDVVEDKNQGRQWGVKKAEGDWKATRTIAALRELCGTGWEGRSYLEDREALQAMVTLAKREGEVIGVIWAAPDRHIGRVNAVEMATAVSREMDVLLVTGGNRGEGAGGEGWVYGGWAIRGEWEKRLDAVYPEVWEEAAREREEGVRPAVHGCGATVEKAGQTVYSNMRTAALMVSTILQMLDEWEGRGVVSRGWMVRSWGE